MKSVWSITIAAVVAVILGGVYFKKTGHTPSSQPALVQVNDETLAALRAEFNRKANTLRVILLLSPT